MKTSTKTPTDFDKYVTAAYYFTRTITVTNLLTPTITNKTEWRLWTMRDNNPGGGYSIYSDHRDDRRIF